MEILKPYTSQTDWIAVGKNLLCKRESSAWELGDWINFGVKEYGKVAAYDHAERVIRRARRSLYLFSHVSRRFEPSRRVPELSFIHHAVVVKYPPAIVDELLREAIANEWTCKQLRTAAEERCGVKKANGRRKKVVVSLAEQNIAHLKELAGGKRLNWFLTGVIEDFLRSKGFAVPERPTTAERREHWEAQGLCRSCGSKPVAEGQRTCDDCRITVTDWQKWNQEEKQSLPASPEDPVSESPRPTYAERRAAQLAAGAAPIPPKRKCLCRIRVLWTECRPKSFVEDNEGKITRFKETIRPTCFKTEEDAAKANDLFKACHGYTEQVVFCTPCGAWHLKHIYAVSIARGAAIEQPVVGQ